MNTIQELEKQEIDRLLSLQVGDPQPVVLGVEREE